MASKEFESNDLKDKERKIKQEFIHPGPKGLNFFHLFMIFWVGGLIYQFYLSQKLKEVPYSEFLNYIEKNQVQRVVLSEKSITATLKIKRENSDKDKVIVTVPVRDDQLVSLLQSKAVEFKAVPEENFFSTLLMWLLPITLILFFLELAFKKNEGSGTRRAFKLSKIKGSSLCGRRNKDHI